MFFKHALGKSSRQDCNRQQKQDFYGQKETQKHRISFSCRRKTSRNPLVRDGLRRRGEKAEGKTRNEKLNGGDHA